MEEHLKSFFCYILLYKQRKEIKQILNISIIVEIKNLFLNYSLILNLFLSWKDIFF